MRTIDNDILLGEICTHLSQGRKVKLRAKGNSMRPFIQGGKDILVLAPPNSLRKGDVVLARIDGKRYVVHRIVAIGEDKITLMGDGNLYETESCSKPDIYGKVESIIRDGKEGTLKSAHSSIMAMIWRAQLPLRRLKYKIFQKLCAPTTPAHQACDANEYSK